MAVRVGNTTFADHVSVEIGTKMWTDTFVYPISYEHGLPPWDYASAVRLLAPTLERMRKGRATIWVPVESPPDPSGTWYYRSVKEHLQNMGLSIPIAVTRGREHLPVMGDFTLFPRTLPYPAEGAPKAGDLDYGKLSTHALRCLQVLNRITVGYTAEVASLIEVSKPTARKALNELAGLGYVEELPDNWDIDAHLGFKPNLESRKKDYQYWRIMRAGTSFALRSVGIPANFDFTGRKERRIKNGRHRQVSRTWSAWLRQAWPNVEIWGSWSEAWIPSEHSNPDGLAWGTYNGFETLFWLEVDSARSSGKDILDTAQKRLLKAIHYAEAMKIRTIFAFLGPQWTIESARPAFVGIPDLMAVVAQDWDRSKFGQLLKPNFGGAVIPENKSLLAKK